MPTLLRLATAGSVDDGKSTLIGRLLYDSKMIFEDQLAAEKSRAEGILESIADGVFTVDLDARHDGRQHRRAQVHELIHAGRAREQPVEAVRAVEVL